MVQNHHIKRIPTPTPSNGQKKRRYQPAQGLGATSSLTGRRQLTLMLDFLTFIHITYPETKTFALRLYPEQERKVRPSKIPSSWASSSLLSQWDSADQIPIRPCLHYFIQKESALLCLLSPVQLLVSCSVDKCEHNWALAFNASSRSPALGIRNNCKANEKKL